MLTAFINFLVEVLRPGSWDSATCYGNDKLYSSSWRFPMVC